MRIYQGQLAVMGAVPRSFHSPSFRSELPCRLLSLSLRPKLPSLDNACRPLRASGNAAEAVPSPQRNDTSGASTPPLQVDGNSPRLAPMAAPVNGSSSAQNAAQKQTKFKPDTVKPSSSTPPVPELPPFPRMTPDDERLAHEEGHFFRRLLDAGLVNADGSVTELGRVKVAPMDATYIHLTINKMLSMNRKYQTVIAVVRDVGAYMGPVNIATAMHRLGRLVRTARAWSPNLPERMLQHPQYVYLLRRAEEVIEEMSPRALANFLWGMAALGDGKNTGIILRLGERLMSIDPSELKTQELSNVLWSMATLEVHLPQLVNLILDSACDRIDDCVPQALSNMIWACATLKHHHPRFPQAVATSAAPRLNSFQSQTLANTLWAYSVLGKYPTDLFNKAAEEIVRRLQPSNDDKAVKSSRPVSRGRPVDSTSFDHPSFLQFQGQEISNVLIAYARGCIIHPQLLQALERELCRTVEVTKDGQVVQIERLKEFTSQALANTLWAFATLRWYPARLLPSITEAIGNIVQVMTAQELANSLWAYARFAYHPGRVMASFLSVMESRVNEFEGQGCTNSLWALAVLKATHSAAFVGLLQRYVALERSAASFGELQYNQVLQAVLLAQFEARGGRVAWRPEVDLPENVVDRALDAWASQQMSTQLSGFHLDVSEGLTRLGVPHLLEHLVARDLLSIDIAVIEEGRKLAIEVDGPFHFPVNARTPLGHTMIRRRLLRAAGWTVLSIPWYEWFAMNTWDQRLNYLTEVLSRADERFAHQLRPTTKELLSTNFSPGPGPEPEEAASASAAATAVEGDAAAAAAEILNQPDTAPTSYDIGEDGPVLSYYGSGSGGGPLEVDNGLLQVLSRGNVQLTTGAIRRLQSMGLEDMIRGVGERRRSAPSSNYNASNIDQLSQQQQNTFDGKPTEENYAPPPSIDPSAGPSGNAYLLPKPRLPPPTPQRTQYTRRPTRFSPRFVSDEDSSWGYFPPTQDEGQNRPPQRKRERGPTKPVYAGETEAMFKKVLHGRATPQQNPQVPQTPTDTTKSITNTNDTSRVDDSSTISDSEP